MTIDVSSTKGSEDAAGPASSLATTPDSLWNRAGINIAYRLRQVSQSIELATMRRRLRRLGAGNVYSIPTWTTRWELNALFALASACPPGAVALEVGSYLGASSCCLAAGLARAGGRLVCVDTWQNDTLPGDPHDVFAEFERNVRGLRASITPIRARSSEIPAADLPEKLHLIFLDGDHRYEAIHAEFELLAPRIVEGGVLAFHDAIAFEGVARTIGEALTRGRWQFGGHVDNLIWLRRVRWIVPEHHPPSH